MIRTMAVFLAIFIFFTGCKKSSSDSSTVVEYQVTATNSSNIDITYNNTLGAKTLTSANNTWTYDITIPSKPYTAYIQASSTSPFSSVTTTCTVNILVNGTVVKTATVSSNTIAKAEAEYTVQ
jgi:hypothetical protein